MDFGDAHDELARTALKEAIAGSVPRLSQIIRATQDEQDRAQVGNADDMEARERVKLRSLHHAAIAFTRNLDDHEEQAALIGLALSALSMLMDVRMPPATLPEEFGATEWDALEELVDRAIAAFVWEVGRYGLEGATKNLYARCANPNGAYGSPAFMVAMMRRLAFLEMTKDLSQR